MISFNITMFFSSGVIWKHHLIYVKVRDVLIKSSCLTFLFLCLHYIALVLFYSWLIRYKTTFWIVVEIKQMSMLPLVWMVLSLFYSIPVRCMIFLDDALSTIYQPVYRPTTTSLLCGNQNVQTFLISAPTGALLFIHLIIQDLYYRPIANH